MLEASEPQGFEALLPSSLKTDDSSVVDTLQDSATSKWKPWPNAYVENQSSINTANALSEQVQGADGQETNFLDSEAEAGECWRAAVRSSFPGTCFFREDMEKTGL